jgi:hypothetical protein
VGEKDGLSAVPPMRNMPETALGVRDMLMVELIMCLTSIGYVKVDVEITKREMGADNVRE